MRSLRGGQPWMLMEQAPSAVNWRPRNAPKRPGRMRLWSYLAVAHGADAVMYFQWRQSRGGAEKFHSAMVPHGGTETRVHREVRELGRELQGLSELAGARSTADVAFLMDWPSWWGLELDSRPSTALRLLDRVHDHYRPLWEASIACDVVSPSADLSGYRLVVVPSVYMVSTEDAERLAAFVRGGGHVLVSFFSGIVDEADRAHPGGYPAAAWREMLGLRVEEFWPLAEGDRIRVDDFDADTWSEHVELRGAEAKATFASGDLAGFPAVTAHQYGSGTATYVATRAEPAAMARIVAEAAAAASVRPVMEGLPAGVEATRRGEYVFLLNHGDEEARVAPSAGSRELLGVGQDGDELILGRDAVAILALE
jgi:beta-galactosidase